MQDERPARIASRRLAGSVLPIVLLATFYLGATLLSRTGTPEGDPGWLAPALAMIIMTAAGTRLWPGVVAGALAAGLTAGMPAVDALLAALVTALVTAGGAQVIRATPPGGRDFADTAFAARFTIGFVLLPAGLMALAVAPPGEGLDLVSVGTRTAVGAIAFITAGAAIVSLGRTARREEPGLAGARTVGLTLLGGTTTLVLGLIGGISALPAVLLVATPILCWPALRGESSAVGLVMSATVCGYGAGLALGRVTGAAPDAVAMEPQALLPLLACVAMLLMTALTVTAVVRRRRVAGDGAERDARRYASLVDGVGDALFSLDDGGRLSFVNRGWEAVTGHPREQSVGRPLHEFLRSPLDQHLPAPLSGKGASDASECSEDLVLTHASGESRTVTVRARRDGREGVRGSLRDISQSRAELARFEEQLRGAAASLDFAAARLQLLHTLTRIDPTRGETEAVMRHAMRCITAAGVFGPRARSAVAVREDAGLRLYGADLAATHAAIPELVERAHDSSRGLASASGTDTELHAVSMPRTEAVWLVESDSRAPLESFDATFLASVANQLDTLLGSCRAESALRGERRQRERLRHQIIELSRRMLELQEDERHRIARELHDELGQWLVGIQAETAHLMADPNVCGHEALAESAESIHLSAARIYDVTHTLMNRLRPPLLDELGLGPAIDELVHLADDMRNGVHITATLDEDLERIDAPLDIHVYRIVQQALMEASRRLDNGALHLRVGHARDDSTLRIELRAQGNPAPPRPSDSRDPVADGLRERVQAVGGELSISGESRDGMLIVALIPSSAQNPADEVDVAPDHRLAH